MFRIQTTMAFVLAISMMTLGCASDEGADLGNQTGEQTGDDTGEETGEDTGQQTDQSVQQQAAQQLAELEQNKALWASQALDDYQFHYMNTGYATDPNREVVITVYDGEILDVTRVSDYRPVSPGWLNYYNPIDELMVHLEEDLTDLANGVGYNRSIEVTYDEDNGVVEEVTFENTSETYGYIISHVTPLDSDCLAEGAACLQEDTLNASWATWLARGTSDTYCVERTELDGGNGWRSAAEYVAGELDYWSIVFIDDSEEVGEETGEGDSALSTSSLRSRERVANFGAVYADCTNNILTLDSGAYEIHVDLDADGLLTACFATERVCEADCTVSVNMTAFTLDTCENTGI